MGDLPMEGEITLYLVYEGAMPTYMRIADVRGMRYEELERWWEVDFEVLVTSAIAEATGDVHRSVREALGSEDWLEHWADALFAASSELRSAVERMEFTRDDRLKDTRDRLNCVTQRMQQVNSLITAKSLEQGHEMGPASQRDAHAAALAILARCYKEEAIELRAQECMRRNLPNDSPFRNASYADAYEAIEDAVGRGVLNAPLTPGVEELRDFTDERFRIWVAKEVSRQEERCDALRHPLLLRRWKQGLQSLLEESCKLSGIAPEFTLSLPQLDMNELRAMAEEDAWKHLKRRRFIRCLAQRHREQKMHTRTAVRVVNVRRSEIEQPWSDATLAAREQLALLHPEEATALESAFFPYCEPGSTKFRRGALSRHDRAELVRDLRKKLLEGTLVNG